MHNSGSVPTDSSARPLADDTGDTNDDSQVIGSPRGQLRIVIPRSPRTPSGESAPRTAMTQPVRGTFPPDQGSSFAALSAAGLPPCDPNVAAAVHHYHTQKSAVALLQANISGRRLRESAKYGSRRSASTNAAFSMDGGAAADPIPRRTSVRFCLDAEAVPVPPAHADPNRLPDATAVEMRCGVDSNVPAGSPSSLAAMERPLSSSSVDLDDEAESGSVDISDGAPSEAESVASDVGMDRVLEEAAKVRGVRLTWLLYLMIILVIILFVLVFLLISFSTNRTVVQSGTHMVESLAVTTTNNIELLRYDLYQFFLLVNSILHTVATPRTASRAITMGLCSRIYGAPISAAYYNASGETTWSLVCDEEEAGRSFVPDSLPNGTIPSPETPRLVTHSDGAVAAYLSDRELGDYGGTFAVYLRKDVLGRFIYSNFLPQYSTATLQGLYMGLLLPNFTSNVPTVAFTSLTPQDNSYDVPQPSLEGNHLQSLFDGICGAGTSKYVWHSVVRERNIAPTDTLRRRGGSWYAFMDPSSNTTTHSFPNMYKEREGAWGVTSRMALCGALCASDDEEKCVASNPTTTWMAMDAMLDELRQESALNAVGAISIVSVVLFSFILLLVYIGISVPVHFLRYQLLRTVGSKAENNGCQRRIFYCTRRFWLSDLVSLVRAIHVLSLCFRLNKKYVPAHVLRNHAKQLYACKGSVAVVNASIDDLLSEDEDEDDFSFRDCDCAQGERHLDDISEFVATAASLQREASLHYPSNAGGGAPELSRREGSDNLAGSLNTTDARNRLTLSSLPSPSPPSRRPTTTAVDDANNNSDGQEDFFIRTHNSLFNTDFLVGDGSPDSGGGGASAMLMATHTNVFSPYPVMQVRRNDEATILCVRVGDVDTAYLLDYDVALRQHRSIMRFLLNRMRHHKGAVFHRSGECLAAAWNAFDGCYSHAEHAAACAQDIANAFAPYRGRGLQIGIVLHQGTLVCGTVEDTKEAFVTAFGEGPRQAIILAELAASQPAFSVLITEPVKQALSSRYECFIVDVVRLPKLIHCLILFELGMSRGKSPRWAQSSPMSSDLSVQYAKTFSLFRNHEFKAAIDGIQTIRDSFSYSETVERLLERLEMLSCYYNHHRAALPSPYSRLYPTWANYELLAEMEAVTDGAVPSGSPTSAISTATATLRNGHFPDATAVSTPPGLHAPAGYAHNLPSVFYPKTMHMYDEEMSFKKELHDNVKRLGTPAVKSPTTHTKAAAPLGAESSGTAWTLSTTQSPYSAGHSQRNDGPGASSTAALAFSELPPSAATLDTKSSLGMPPQSHTTPESAVGLASAGRSSIANSTSGEATAIPPPPLSGFDPLFPDRPAMSRGSRSPTSSDGRGATARPESAIGPTGTTATKVEVSCRARMLQGLGTAFTSPSSRPFTPASDNPVSVVSDDILLSQRCFSMTNHCSQHPPRAIDASAASDGEEEGGEPAVSGMPRPRLASSASVGSEGIHREPSEMSLIKSMGVSLAEADGHMHSMNFTRSDLPTEVVGKNGTTYMRSARVLGRGSFGSVYLGMDIHSGKLVAIKFLALPLDESELQAVEAEVVIMQRVKDAHVVEFVTYAFEGENIILVMECMMAGSLQNMISAFKIIPTATAHVFMRDVLRGLHKLHTMGVIHRDVKPQNVLLTLAGHCKISDFGASAWLHELARKEAQGQVLGTPVYLAPEAARGMPVEASDVWSCGIMFLQLVTGRLPYPQEQLSLPAPILVYQIGIGDAVPVIPDTLDELDAAFVKHCLQTDPQERRSAQQLLQMPLFTL